MITIKLPEEIAVIREGGQKLAAILAVLIKKTKIGISTKELDNLAEKMIIEAGGVPSFKAYDGFPATICTSINEEIVHGIPSERILKEGDIFSIDIGMFYKGFHTDMATTIAVGNVSWEAHRLIYVTKKALKYGIKKAHAGNTFGDIGNTIQRYVESQGFSVVRDLCGHGIGHDLHEDPPILNFGRRHIGPVIKPGMTFCIEPMVAAGGGEIKRAKNGQTYITRDKSLSAHFEHTIAVTDHGVEILTQTADQLLNSPDK